jgi:hypothetical protein
LLEELKFLTSTPQLLQDFKIRLENRKKILRHLPELCIKTLAELNHFASQRLVKYLCYIIYIMKSSLILSILHQMTTKAQYDAEADLDKMIVLSTTTNAKEVLHASDINPPTLPVVSDGVIFSSKRHLHNIMLALEANVDGFAVQVDGTFKITTGSAVLLVLVTTSITVGPTITHTPRPLMYGFVPSESEYATATLLHCFQAAARQLLGIKRMPPITTAAIDHALGFRLGLKRVFPYVTIISCYFHMLKNVQQNTAKKIMNEANKGRIVCDLQALALSTSVELFNIASRAALHYWEHVLLEIQFVEHFKGTYMVHGWQNWFASASGVIGIGVTTNAVESFNHSIKNIIDVRFNPGYVI